MSPSCSSSLRPGRAGTSRRPRRPRLPRRPRRLGVSVLVGGSSSARRSRCRSRSLLRLPRAVVLVRSRTARHRTSCAARGTASSAAGRCGGRRSASGSAARRRRLGRRRPCTVPRRLGGVPLLPSPWRPASPEPGCCGSRRTAGPSSTGSRWSSRRGRRSGTRCRRRRRPPAARRAASSAAGRTGRVSASAGMFLLISWRWVVNVVAVIATTRIAARIWTATSPSALRNVRRDRDRPRTASRSPKLVARSLVMKPCAVPFFGGLVEQPEQREEDRHLQQDRQAGGERVGARLLVELHRLLGELLPVVAVLLLQLLDLGLDQLHVPAGLDLLDEQRDQRGPDDQRQADDRQHPGGAAVGGSSTDG